MRSALCLATSCLVACGAGSSTGPGDRTEWAVAPTTSVAPEPVPPLDPNAPAIETFRLGGIEQSVLISGDRQGALPILLFLHGGPGNSEIPVAHLYTEHLTPSFLVAHWDQRGAGRSYDPAMDPASITLARIVADGVELTRQLTARFPGRQVMLVGQSWGSVVGVQMATRSPRLFCAYVGVGQLVSPGTNLSVSRDFALAQATEAGHDEVVASLRALDPLGPEDIGEVMAAVTRYGGNFAGHDDVRAFERLADAGPFPREPWERAYEDQALSMRALGPEIMRLDLSRTHRQFELPIAVIAGVHDFVTPRAIAEQYLSDVRTASKVFYVFPNSAHHPQLEEPERFANAVSRLAGNHCGGTTNP